MAINFLNSLNINKNSVEQLRIVNHINDAAAGAGVVGQLYYQTGSGNEFLKVYRQTGFEVGNETFAWEEVGGGVTSLTTSDGTFINLTPNSPQVGDVSVSADLSATGTASSSSFLAGNNAWAIPPGTYSWTVKGDAASTTAVASGETVTILGGANISATLSTRTITLAYTGPDYNSFRLGADSGTDVAVLSGKTADIVGGTYAATSVAALGSAAGAAVTINVDATTAATASKVVARDGDGYAYAVTPDEGDNTTKLATTAFVERSLTSALQFKGGFNATTGTIDGGTTNLTKDDQPSAGDTRVAIAVGDYYVCTTAGNFFANTNTPLTAGDSVIAKENKAAGASSESDFIIVQSDTDVASASQIGIGNVNAVTNGGVDVSYASGTASVKMDIDDLSAGSGIPVTVAAEDSSGNTKKFAFSAFASSALAGKSVILNAATTGVGRDVTTISGSTIYTINLSSPTSTPAGVWDDSVAARHVQVQVTQNTGTLDTVYAQVQRRDNSSPGSKSYIDITFVGTVGNSDYVALLTNVVQS
jgi:hypothetical protein